MFVKVARGPSFEITPPVLRQDLLGKKGVLLGTSNALATFIMLERKSERRHL